VTVRAEGRYAEARDILRNYGAYDVHDRTAAGAKSTDAWRADAASERRLSANEVGSVDEAKLPSNL
jgi:hypothetical protein